MSARNEVGPALVEAMSIPLTETGCWYWLGFTNDKGYGRLRIRNDKVLAHRVSFLAYNGPIPEGLSVMHKCDCTYCVNPEHLVLGTQADNMADAARKRRMNHKLTEAQARDILTSPLRAVELAKKYGVALRTVYWVKQRITWSDL